MRKAIEGREDIAVDYIAGVDDIAGVADIARVYDSNGTMRRGGYCDDVFIGGRLILPLLVRCWLIAAMTRRIFRAVSLLVRRWLIAAMTRRVLRTVAPKGEQYY